MTVNVIISPTSAQYLKFHLKQNDEGELFFNAKHLLYHFLLSFTKPGVSKPFSPGDIPEGRQQVKIKFGDRIVKDGKLVQDFRYSSRFMPPENHEKLEAYINQHILEQAFAFITGYITSRGGDGINEAIELFMLEYQFQKKHFTLESLKKAYYRARKSEDIKNNTIKSLVYKGKEKKGIVCPVKLKNSARYVKKKDKLVLGFMKEVRKELDDIFDEIFFENLKLLQRKK